MNTNDLISIVVPVYKVEDCIRTCIESIVKQSYTNIEVILVDDGSPDMCGSICDEYADKDTRIKVIHKQNGGLSDARNAGIDIATGKYISFIDSDDYIKSDCIEKLYNSIVNNQCDISICSEEVLYEDCVKKYNVDNYKDYETVLTPEHTLERMLYKDGFDVSAWAKLYKRSLFDDIRYPVGRLFEDAATTYKLIIKAKKIVYIKYSGYKYVMRKDSITNEKFNEKKFDLIKSTEEMCDVIDSVFPTLIKATQRRRVYANFSTLRLMGDVYKQYDAEVTNMIKEINLYRKYVLRDKKVGSRDKFAIIMLAAGKTTFFKAWYVYCKLTHRG